MLYGFIADANWDALGGNPENVAVGMELSIPCVDASGEVLTPEQAQEASSSLEAAVAAEGPLEPEELHVLFGPVALFPDQVLTSVLVASTFPLDVVKAGRFVEGSAELSDQERAAGAADQAWDDSVRELAAGFPAVVTRMSDNIDWTEQAGEAVVAQTGDVLDAIQRLRTEAQENGYLIDNEAQTVEEQGDKIVIAPADSNVVYVPTYDSQVVYRTPAAGPPVYHYGYDYNANWYGWDDALVTGGIVLGGAIILDEIFDDDDWDGWDIDDDIDWDRGDITIDRGDIDIDIDRDDINIGDGERPGIGDGDRPQIGDGDRISIGDSDRTQIDRDDFAGIGDRVGSGDRPGAGNRTPISSDASREVARQKIEARRSAGGQPADLRPARHVGQRPDGIGSRDAIQPRATNRTPQVSRPQTSRTPSARAPSRSNTFSRPSGGHRAGAASHRGRASMGGRGGGRAGGRGGRGRGGGRR